jgi:hypothetical protein
MKTQFGEAVTSRRLPQHTALAPSTSTTFRSAWAMWMASERWIDHNCFLQPPALVAITLLRYTVIPATHFSPFPKFCPSQTCCEG